MKWTSALSRNTDLAAAIEAVASVVLAELGGAPDLVFVFASEHYRSDFARLPGELRARLGAVCLVGCSASGVICNGNEVEQEPGLSITAAVLPDVRIDCWHLEANELRPGSPHSQYCSELALGEHGSPEQFLVLADPFSFPTEQLLRSLEGAFTTSVIAGGLASGGQNAGEIVLFLNDAMHASGALGIGLAGNIEMLTAVAQGCRPIGEPMFVSACEGNKLSALDGRATTEILQALFEDADNEEQQLMQHSLFLGLTMQSGNSHYQQGDFLIRNIAGGDADRRALWIAADLRENQVVQFHVRDAQTSSEDLTRGLTRLHGELGSDNAEGCLLFSCTGRGRGLYGRPNHDVSAFIDELGPIPLGGFFCNGEIGPVSGQTFIHGYTSAFAIFRPRRVDAQ